MKINGAPATSGDPSAVVGLREGKNTISIEVRSQDGARQATYTIAVDAFAQEAYVKASNASGGSEFGVAVALSSDGTTLAVGARNESGKGVGINGDQTISLGVFSGAVYVFRRSGQTWRQEAYVKASTSGVDIAFGSHVALSADGNVLAVGAITESSGVAGNPSDTSAPGAGAVYVFRRAGATWAQEAYLKASNPRPQAFFAAVALSSDGSTLVVGAAGEPSSAKGIGGDQNDVSTVLAGAVYVFRRDWTKWSQEAYVKASNTRKNARFGASVAVSSDGLKLAAAAHGEASGATGVGGNEDDTSQAGAGAAYVFSRQGSAWAQDAYVKASNTRTGDAFGTGLGLSSSGNILAVGAPNESSRATGINGDQNDTSLAAAGAAYVFTREGTKWTQEVYLKASNPQTLASFGSAVALSGDGSALAIGSPSETSAARGIDGSQVDGHIPNAGAVYVFARAGTAWAQDAYVKASNSREDVYFGASLVLSPDGGMLVVGASHESSSSVGVNGNQSDTAADLAGAVYVLTKSGATWSQDAYLKASNTVPFVPAQFGGSIALSADRRKLVVGARFEQGRATGINGDQKDTVMEFTGAAYAFVSSGAEWTQKAYVKASNTHGDQFFGTSVALSSDGSTVAVGAVGDSSAATGINGDQSDVTASNSGAVYVFR